MSKTAIIGNAIAQGIADYINQRYRDKREKREYELNNSRKRRERIEAEEDAETIRNMNTYNQKKTENEMSSFDANILANRNKAEHERYIADRQNIMNKINDLTFDVSLNKLGKDKTMSEYGITPEMINLEKAKAKSGLNSDISTNNTNIKTNKYKGEYADMQTRLLPTEEKKLRLQNANDIVSAITNGANIPLKAQLEAKKLAYELNNIGKENELNAINVANDLESAKMKNEMLKNPEIRKQIAAGMLYGKNSKGDGGSAHDDLKDKAAAISSLLNAFKMKDEIGKETIDPETLKVLSNAGLDVTDAIVSSLKPDSANNANSSLNILDSLFSLLMPEYVKQQATQQVAGQTPEQLTNSGINGSINNSKKEFGPWR